MGRFAQIQTIIRPGPSKTVCVSKRCRIGFPGTAASQWGDVSGKGPSGAAQ